MLRSPTRRSPHRLSMGSRRGTAAPDWTFVRVWNIAGTCDNMDSNAYAFNRDASYPARAGFPQNVAREDLLEAHIQVVVPGKAGGRGDFTADVEDIFSKYRLPHISSETVVGLWQTNPMGFWQNQVNFAVWCSTTGCGVSWRDHLDIDRPLARSVFRFHTYYQVRRILDELQAPLPQDQAWAPFQNPYDHRAYERLCREFSVDPSTDWRQRDSESGGLGTVYQYNHGYQPKGSWNRNRMRFQPDSSLSANSSLWSREHVDYIAQGPEADEAWSSFILDKSQGFTGPGVERLNDSIRTYVWAILGAQAQTRSAILGAGTSFDAQKQFLANVEDAILSPVDIPSAIERYQSVLQNASSKVDYAFGTGLYMAPSDMRLHIGTVSGYNNNIVIAPVGQPLGVSPDINGTPVPAPVETGETGLVVPRQSRTHDKPDTSVVTTTPAPPTPVPPEQTQKAQDHKDEKTALVAAGVVLGLVSLTLVSLMRR